MKEKYELAYEDYIAGMKYKEIAAKYEVTINTVKSWKKRYWKERIGCTQKEKVAHKKVATKIANKIVDDNEELDDGKQLFCIYYLKYHNAVKAYLKVKPNAKYTSAVVTASKWKNSPEVIEELRRLKKEMYTDVLLDPQDIVQKYIDIAFADINDYLEYGRELVPVMGPFGPIIMKDEETGQTEPVMKEINIVKFKNSQKVDGTILSEVKQGKDGASIKLADRLKALDWLSKHLDMATEEQKAKIELIKAQTSKISEPEDPETENDGFIDALNESVKEDWEDEEETSSI